MKNSKSVIAILVIALGLICVGFGGYKFMFSDTEEKKTDDKKEENKKEENKKEDDFSSDIKSEIEKYLKDKYNEEFEVVKLAKTFCLETSETNLYYSEPCTDKKIKNNIYEAKNSEGLSFYVKKVSYDSEKIVLTDEYDINTQSVGLYDTYISFIVANKLESKLESLYSSFFNTNISVTISDGLGISDFDYDNPYMYLGKDIQKFTDKNISIDEYINSFDEFGRNVKLLVKIDQDITKDNFQSIVSTIRNNSFVSSGLSIEINDIIFVFNNEERYIEYSMGGLVRLKSGNYTETLESEDLYEKSIVLKSDIFSSDGISYDEFMALDPATFNF